MASTKYVISDSEILAQTKNRQEDAMLGVRLRSIQVKEDMEEGSLMKARKRLIESMKKNLRTSGWSLDPEQHSNTHIPVGTKFYQKPWAYSFSETTHNAIYKDIAQLPRKLPRETKPIHSVRASMSSAPVLDSRARSLPIAARSQAALNTSALDCVQNIGNPKVFARSNNNRSLRPHSCGFRNVNAHSDNVRFRFKRPSTSQVSCRKQSQITDTKGNIDPIFDPISANGLVDDNEDNYMTRCIGNAGRVSSYIYHHRSNEPSTYVWFRGRKIRNYIRPQERYKRDPLSLMKREKLALKLSKNESDSLEDSRKCALKACEAFPKAARLRVLNQLIESNVPKSNGPCVDSNVELQERICQFLQSISAFCESRRSSTKE